MDSIRKALGEDTISYFGFSYGSELGATWATLFPDTVRAAVLDGAIDPERRRPRRRRSSQTIGFENSLTTFLAGCSADPACSFHHDGDAEGAFDRLMLKLDAKPLPTTPGRPSLTRGMALMAATRRSTTRPIRPNWPTRSSPPSRATATRCSPSSTTTTGATPTARGATTMRRSR